MVVVGLSLPASSIVAETYAFPVLGALTWEPDDFIIAIRGLETADFAMARGDRAQERSGGVG
jgi:hypothetical protein